MVRKPLNQCCPKSKDNTFDGPKSMVRDPYGPTSMIFNFAYQSGTNDWQESKFRLIPDK